VESRIERRHGADVTHGLEGPPAPASPSSGTARPADLALPLLAFAACAGLVWLACFGLWKALPGIRAGHVQIYASATRAIRVGQLFPPDAEMRLVIFGNSQIQAGFVPKAFDAASGGRVASYNLGLPNTTAFIDELEILVRREPAPTHVLITQLWDETPAPSLADRFMDDAGLLRDLFPFKDLPRDLFLFTARSFAKGGPLAFYRRSIANVEQSVADRGYYFITEMSHFPGNRLPPDFRLDSDDPNAFKPRDVPPRGRVAAQVSAIAEDLPLYLVPTMSRIGQYRDAVRDEAAVASLAEYGVEVLGPDYWLLPNAMFSDPLHLNPEGARCYTRLLWELVAPALTGEPGDPATAARARSTRPGCP
jgi:hypothetical protein